MGGLNQPFPRLLKIVKWRLIPCPFYFRVAHPFRFLREIIYLRQKRSRRLLLDTLAFSGLGWFGFKALHKWKDWRGFQGSPGTKCHLVAEVSSLADVLLERAPGPYALIAVRGAVVLDTLD